MSIISKSDSSSGTPPVRNGSGRLFLPTSRIVQSQLLSTISPVKHLLTLLSDIQSFQNVNKWIEDIRAIRGSDVLIYLVGNKLDLAEERKVSEEEAKEVASGLSV